MNIPHRLTSDELGALGENIFQQLCLEAGLTCNVPNRDRNGWDAIVQFPFANRHEQKPFDKRDLPVTAYVQIKTMWAKNSFFKIRLSAAEWLVKEEKPSFILIFKIGTDQKPESLLVIHVYDVVAFTVLKKLRQATKDGKRKVNREFINLDSRKLGEPILPTSENVVKSMLEFCGEDIDTYGDRKKALIRKLGYGERPFELKTNIKTDGIEELVDAFLGKVSLTATYIRGSETRFDISLLEFESHGGIITITPTPADTCTIIANSVDTSFSATFFGDIIVPGMPSIPEKHFKWLIKCTFFTFEFSNGMVSLISNNEALQKNAFYCDDWLNYFRFSAILASGNAMVNIRPTRLNETSTPFPLEPNVEQLNEARSCIECCESLRFLFSKVTPSQLVFNFFRISDDDKEEVCRLKKLFMGEHLGNLIEFVTDDMDVVLPSSIKFILIGYINVDGTFLLYFYFAEMVPERRDNRISWISKNVTRGGLSITSSFPDDYIAFAELKKTSNQFEGVYMRSV